MDLKPSAAVWEVLVVVLKPSTTPLAESDIPRSPGAVAAQEDGDGNGQQNVAVGGAVVDGVGAVVVGAVGAVGGGGVGGGVGAVDVGAVGAVVGGAVVVGAVVVAAGGGGDDASLAENALLACL